MFIYIFTSYKKDAYISFDLLIMKLHTITTILSLHFGSYFKTGSSQ
jgi:hypothetical protein